MRENLSVKSKLSITESNGKSIAELMDMLITPAILAEIAEKSSPAGREWDPKILLEIDQSRPKSEVQ